MYPKIHLVPHISREEMHLIDRLMHETFHIEPLQTAENAGRALAKLARNIFLDGVAAGKRVLVLAGAGGNGGGALAAARHLHNWGASVLILLAGEADQYSGMAHHQLNIAEEIGIDVIDDLSGFDSSVRYDALIDGVLGCGIRGVPRGQAAKIIAMANSLKAAILSLDLPSGLDPDAGIVGKHYVRARATMALALPKNVFLNQEARPAAGTLYLADIGVPPELYKTYLPGINVPPLFLQSGIVEIA